MRLRRWSSLPRSQQIGSLQAPRTDHRAFNGMPDLELVIAGEGPEAQRLKQMAAANVRFVGFFPTNTFAC